MTNEQASGFERWRGNRSIRWKILAGYGLLLTLIGAIILSTLLTLRSYSDTADWVRESIDSVALMTKTTVTLLQQSSAHRGYMLTGDEEYRAATAAIRELYQQQLTQLQETSSSAQAQRWLTIQRTVTQRFADYTEPGYELRQRYDDGLATMDEIIAYVMGGATDENLSLIGDTIGEIEAAEYAALGQRMAAIEGGVGFLRWLLILGGLTILVLGIFLARYIVRDISNPIIRVAVAARDIAAGNLDRRIGLRRGDELGQLAASFDLMAERLQRLVQEQEDSLHAIQEQKDVLRSVMDAVPVGIILIGLDGKIQLVNQPVGDLLETGSASLVGLDISAANAALQSGGASQTALIAELSADGAGSDLSSVAVHEVAAPEPRTLEIHAAPVHSEPGGHIGRIFTIRDLTREREMDRMKTEFVSMVSHELRTPLTSIKGYVDLMRDGEVGDLTDQQLAFLDIVAASTDRLVTLINDLLDISRIEAGKVELKRERIDLGQTIRSVAATLRPQIEAKHQALTLDLPDRLSVTADPDRVAQIVTNLLSNAHKYTPANQAITIAAESLDDAVRVHVSDTGIGLSREEQAQLFNRFYRSTNRAAREAEGTGLGLAITRSLVELHGGTISVRSAPGRGSTFSVTLPREVPPPPGDGDQDASA